MPNEKPAKYEIQQLVESLVTAYTSPIRFEYHVERHVTLKSAPQFSELVSCTLWFIWECENTQICLAKKFLTELQENGEANSSVGKGVKVQRYETTIDDELSKIRLNAAKKFILNGNYLPEDNK
ncbi:hypothetical protein TNCV_253281 [Trichonephila clavipes]|nr:hypothetical protein TNCV_253281 [Trichonephila clavipes]